MRAHLVTTCFGLTALLAGCGSDFDPKSLLNKYRILAIQADPAELAFDPQNPTAEASTTLKLVDFDPASVGLDPDAEPPKYRWSYCTISMGSAGEFACLDPLEDHPLGGTGTSVVFDLGLELPVILADLNEFAAAAGVDPSSLAAPRCGLSSLPVQIKLEVEHASVGTITTVKTLNLRLPPQGETAEPPKVNQNPKITGFTVAGKDACTADAVVDGCFVAAPVGSPTLDLKVEIADGGAESYEVSSLDSAGDCVTETKTETLFYSWYTSVGEVKFGVTNAETLENQLKLPKSFPEDRTGPTMPVRVFVVVRDGRGGVDTREAAFQLTETPESASPSP